MGEIRKQSVFSTIYIYAGVLVGFISTGILMPRFLSEGENGILKLILSYSLLFAQFASLGFPIATIKFFPQFRNKEKGHSGFFTLLLLVGLLGFLLFTLIYYGVKPSIIAREQTKSSIFADYFFLILPLTFFEIYFNLIDGYARALFKSTIGSFLKEFLQRVFILLILLLYIFDWVSFNQFIFLYIGALSLATILLFFILYFQQEISWSLRIFSINRKLIPGMVSLSAFGLITGFSSIAISQVDSIMINYFYNPDLTGIYTITFYYGTLVIMPSRALFRIASSYISEAFNRNDIVEIRNLQYKSCLNQYVIGWLLFLLLWVNIDNVFLILPASYLPGKYVIFLIGTGNLLHMLSGLSSQIIINSPSYHFSGIFVLIFLILLIVADLILIPIYGIVGAATGSLIAILFFTLQKTVFLYRRYGIWPYDFKYLTVTLIGLAAYFLTKYLPLPETLLINLPLKSLILLTIFIPPLYFLNISEDINSMIRKLIQVLTFKKQTTGSSEKP